MHINPLYSTAVEIQLLTALLLKYFGQALEERLRVYGEKISSLQHGILRMLQTETLTISEISQRLGLDPSTLVRAVDSLERKELAQRGSDPHDRRRNPISITEKGRQLIETIPVISPDDPPFQALQSLGLEQTQELRRLLFQAVYNIPEGRQILDSFSGTTRQ